MGRPHQDLLASFREIHSVFSRLYAHKLARLGLTLPQYALLNLLESSRGLTMTEASRKLHITKPAVTHLADHLEKKRLVRRLEHADDRRAYVLEIKPEGERAVRRMQSEILSLLFGALRSFTPREQRVIARFYGFMAQSLSRELAAKAVRR